MEKSVWFDVDDVLVDTASSIESSLERFTGKHIPKKQWANLYFTDIYGIDSAQAMREWWVKDQMLENSKILKPAVQAIKEISEDGYDVYLITARAWHPDGEEITWEMVKRHGMNVKGVKLVHFDESKPEVMNNTGLNISGFVDDSSSHINKARNYGWNAALIKQPWNSTEKGNHCIKNVGEFPRWLKKFKENEIE